MLYSNAVVDANLREVQEAPISTKRIKQAFNLVSEEDKDKFEVFESYVGDVCKSAI
jgi:hypothetical protein